MTRGLEPRALVTELWQSLPRHITSILGVEVKLGSFSIETTPFASKDGYIATLRLERPVAEDAFVVIDVGSAIACSGLLVMMQEKVIKEKIKRAEFGEDDIDAMGECVNQFVSVFNDTLHALLSPEHHIRFAAGEIGSEEIAARVAALAMVRATSTFHIKGIHDGTIEVLLPSLLFERPAVASEADGDDADKAEEPEALPSAGAKDRDARSAAAGPGRDPGARAPAAAFRDTLAAPGGLELTPEEAEALRAATRASFAESNDLVVVLAPSDGEQRAWEDVFGRNGMVHHLVADLYAVRSEVRQRGAMVVVIDADACQGGGLPALAALRSWVGAKVPVVIAASTPTRTHLMSAMASGAASYLVKPIDPELFRTRIEEICTVWQNRATASFSAGL